MKRTIRPGVFETNSSMTHTLVIASSEDGRKWENGDLVLFKRWGAPKLVSEEEKNEIIADPDGYWGEEDFYTHEDFETDRGYYELYYDSGKFTTPSGDEMVWYASYGRDG